MTRVSTLIALLALVGCEKTNEPTDTSTGDTDTDTDVAAIVQPDRDEDTIIDVHETEKDADEDGKPNADDKESDGDGIRDAVEAGDKDLNTLPIDSDGDGDPDFLDLDSDNNCLKDKVEAGRDDGGAVDTDEDGVQDYADPDNDGDAILDTLEIQDIGACSPVDSDGDTVPDYMDRDSDNDGIGDLFEGGTTEFDILPSDTDSDGIPDYLDPDSDNDGTADKDESGVASVDTLPRDTDGDGLYDFQDLDADGDGLSDADEKNIYKTDPYDFDSDGDGFSDGGEILAETDPLDPTSVIDGVYVVVGERTETEENFKFLLRIERGDVGLIVDTTCSMGGTITAAKKVFTTIINDLPTFDDVAAGAAGFDDYAYGSFGSAGSDKPYYNLTPITSDLAEVQVGVNKLSTHSGNDGPESGTEAYYQGASGAGYDQDCDGSYDTLTDVVPFVASATDPFKGKGGEWYDPTLPDNGTRGGFGFREYAIPFIVLIQDNYMRDPDSANPAYNRTPGGCPIDAGMSDAVKAFLDLGGYPITVQVASVPGSGLGTPQAQTLAEDVGAIADMNGDGDLDDTEDLLVTELNQSSATYATDISDFVILAVEELVSAIKFTEVTLEIEGDEYGFVVGIDPEKYTDIDPDAATELDFTLTFRGTVAATTEDQLFRLVLNVIGDGTTLVGTKDIILVVQGNGGG
jgi:hypothetical protein